MEDRYEFIEREDESISSGETEILLDQEDQWQKLYQADDSHGFRQWDTEQIFDDPEPFMNAVKEIHVIPDYYFVLNYLMVRVKLALSNENRKGFFKYLEAGNFPDSHFLVNLSEECQELLRTDCADGQKIFSDLDFDTIWLQLVWKMDAIFRKNGNEDPIDWIGFFRGIVTNFTFDYLKQIAFGMHMSLSDYDVFLRKVLRRTYINFYDREEIFIYLVLKYADQMGIPQYFAAYRTLKTLYSSQAVEETENNEEPEILRAFEEYLLEPDAFKGSEIEKREMEQLARKEKSENPTIYIRSKMDYLICHLEENFFEQADQNLLLYLKQVEKKYRKLSNQEIQRTAILRFQKLWEELKDKMGKSEDFRRRLQEDRNGAGGTAHGLDENGIFQAELMVHYPPGKDLILPAGTEFRTTSMIESVSGSAEAIFQTREEQVLPKADQDYVLIHVKALQENNPLKIKGVKFNEFVSDEFLENLRKRGETVTEIEPEEEALKKVIRKIHVGSKLRFTSKENKLNRGILELECAIGTYIPAGTIFSFRIHDFTFSYETVEPETNEEYEKANLRRYEVRLTPRISWDEASFMEEKGEPLSLLEPLDGVSAVTQKGFNLYYGGKVLVSAEREATLTLDMRFTLNGHGSTIFQPKQETVLSKKKDRFQASVSLIPSSFTPLKKGTFIPSGSNLQVIPPPGGELPKGLLRAYTGRSNMLALFQEGREHLLTLLCTKECHIPENTVFRYEYGGYSYDFILEETFSRSTFLSAKVSAKWINQKEFEERLFDLYDGNEPGDPISRDFIRSNAVFQSSCTDLAHVYMPKRITLTYNRSDRKRSFEYQMGNTFLMRQIYNLPDLFAGGIDYYVGFPDMGEDFFLNTGYFKQTKITQGVLNKLLNNGNADQAPSGQRSLSLSEDRLRNLLLTLKFIDYVWFDLGLFSNGNSFQKSMESKRQQVNYKYRVSDFITESADEELLRCGMMPFSIVSFPYDRFLALLLQSDDPGGLFQTIWSPNDFRKEEF